jgi:hypothetical protein
MGGAIPPKSLAQIEAVYPIGIFTVSSSLSVPKCCQ